MERFADWEARLEAYLEPLREKPFEWGKHDCCTFTAGAIREMSGFDPMRGFRGLYRSKGTAEKLIAERGGTLAAILDGMFASIPPARAHRGDLVKTPCGLGLAYGPVSIHVGEDGGRPGLVRMPRFQQGRDQWELAWLVPMPGA